MKGDALGHQTGNECDIAGEPVELGHQDGAFGGARGRQRRGKLWPPIERVGPLAGFGLDELTDDRNPLDLREATDGRSLRLDPEPGAVLLLRGDSQIGDRLPHTNCIPPFAVCMNS
jgi:hypothetical protein